MKKKKLKIIVFCIVALCLLILDFTSSWAQESQTKGGSYINIGEIMIRVFQDVHSHKIPKSSLRLYRQKASEIKKEELGFYKLNGGKYLTDDQKNQLDDKLNSIMSSL